MKVSYSKTKFALLSYGYTWNFLKAWEPFGWLGNHFASFVLRFLSIGNVGYNLCK